MHNFASISTDRSLVHGIELFRLWDVEEDETYQIKRTWDSWQGPNSTMPVAGRNGLCAARTISGQGWLSTADGGRQDLRPGSLVILPWLDLTGWGTSGEAWRFYWFEFFADQAEPPLLREAVQVPGVHGESPEITSIQSQLRSPLEATRRVASARFLALMYKWLEQAAAQSVACKHQPGIERAIDLMHRRIDAQLSVPEMAKEAGLGSRVFATAFEQSTGQTPKRYHLNLRLDAAQALLLSGRANVKQAAAQLGFSSPFYLSKLYTKRYGHPPSQAH